MNLIHISDIHTVNSSDHGRVIDALCQDIADLHREEKINAILCTGDIANRGDTSSEAISMQEKIIRKIIGATEGEAVFMSCPGNHDINLKKRNPVFEPIFASIVSSEKANELLENSLRTDIPGIWEHLDGYISLSQKIDQDSYKKNKLYTTKKIEHNGVKIGIASLNSAWRTLGGGDKDRGQLFVGETQIESAVKDIEDCEIKIAMLHHTLEWLNSDEKNKCQLILATSFDLLLCGHNHNNSACNLTSNIGTLNISNTGCIYETRTYFNGYSLIKINQPAGHITIKAREYYSQRGVFDISPRFSANGLLELPMRKRAASGLLRIPKAAISAACAKANSKLLSASASEVAPKQISSIFVEPPLAKVSERKFSALEGLNGAQEKESTTLTEISKLSSDLLLIGKRESGKTTLINHIAVNCFMEFHASAIAGLTIDMSTLYKDTIAAALSQAIDFLDNEITKAELIEILKLGHALVIFDNISIHNSNHIKIIRQFCESYPNCRYIYATAEEIQDELNIDTPNLMPRETTHIYIHSFKSKHTKELVQKWFGRHDAEPEKKLTLIKKLLSKLNVPQTPFLISVLLWVIEQQPQAKLINQASAIEALVDGLLEKFTESKSRSNYDSNIQSHFLSEFSHHLDQQNKEWIESNEFESFVTKYFQIRGLPALIRGFTEELLKKGLIYENNGLITFKFDCFRAFFLAKKLSENRDLLDKSLKPMNIVRYATELDLLTGLHRDRKEILISARTCCEELLTESGLDTDLSLFEAQGVERGLLNNSETLSNIESNILNEPMNLEERDERINDVEVTSEASLDHNHARKRQLRQDTSKQAYFVSALKTYSNILRNSELIDDIDLKESALSYALELWSKLIITTYEIIRNTKLSELPEKADTGLGELTPSEFEKIARLLMPQAISAIMTESLATPKLEKFVLDEARSPTPVIKFLATMLCTENINSASIEVIKNNLKSLCKNNIAIQAIFIKLVTMYYFDAPKESLPALRDCLGEAFASLKGGSNMEKTIYKGRFLRHIDEKRIKSLDDIL